jgi:hypothetical protein
MDVRAVALSGGCAAITANSATVYQRPGVYGKPGAAHLPLDSTSVGIGGAQSTFEAKARRGSREDARGCVRLRHKMIVTFYAAYYQNTTV